MSRKWIALIVALGGMLAMPAGASAVVLYDQTDDPGPANPSPAGNDFSPSNYFTAGNQDWTADDFTVPEGETWTIEGVEVGGAYQTTGATEEANVFIYADANGAPGAELFSQLNVAAPGPDYEVPVTGAPPLTAGTYWLSVQQSSASPVFWTWQTRTVQSGNPAHWRSTTGGPPPCDNGNWGRRDACWPSLNPDQVFLLQGTKAVPPPPAVVTPKLTLGKLEPNKRRGTARQPAFVNAPGTVELSGKNVATKTKTAAADSTVTLKVKPRGRTLEKLETQGHARTKITVTFTPDAGAADTVKRLIVLRKRG